MLTCKSLPGGIVKGKLHQKNSMPGIHYSFLFFILCFLSGKNVQQKCLAFNI